MIVATLRATIMTNDKKQNEITWDPDVQKKLDQMIAKIPVFLKDMALKKVSQKALDLAQKDNRKSVSEKDMVDAFFAATPFGFHGPMKKDMEDLNIDYQKYGHSK
jgi:hypothetical protein